MLENNASSDALQGARATTHVPQATLATPATQKNTQATTLATEQAITPIKQQQPQPHQPHQPHQPYQPQKTKPGWSIPAKHWQLIFKVMGAEAYDLIQSIEEGVPNRPNDSACNEVRCLLFTIRKLAERIELISPTILAT
jgi:hypothetical protein